MMLSRTRLLAALALVLLVVACGSDDETWIGPGGAGGTGGTAGSGGTAGAGGSGGIPEIPLLDTVSQYGITWTFSEPVPVGQFVNGDYYVVGSTTITAIDPAPTSGRNGSVVNLPAIQDKTGFDDRTAANRYDASLRAELPIALTPGNSLASSISVATPGQNECMLRTEDSSDSPVKTVAVLTCLDAAVPADTFRPSYADQQNRLYHAGALRRDLLLSLAAVPSTPELAEFERYFERPWIDNLFFQFDAPVDNMPCYGREIARAVSNATLLLMVDLPIEQRETLLIRVVQYGIDLWGLVRAGYPGWQAHGGHGNGRKWPIVFAGILLDDPDMQAIATSYPEVRFSEDMQTIYDTGWTGASVVYGGHVGPDGESVNPGWGPYEHLQPSQWLGDAIGEGYRRCCTSLGWVGESLSARMLGAESLWNHDPFFAYTDRWMTEDDSAHVQQILTDTGHDYTASWARQGQAWDDFVEEMWATYRGDY